MSERIPQQQAVNNRRKDQRHRFQFRFWIDANKAEEQEIGHALEELKRHRQYAPTIRDALRLILSLRIHQVNVLLEFFPWIDDYFRAKYAVQDSPAVSEFARLVQEQTRILEQLARQPQTYLPAPQAVFALHTSLDDKIGELEATSSSIFTDTAVADPIQVRAAFSTGMGSLFEEDDADLWND